VNVLYEDNHIVVAEKPGGIPVQSDSSGDISFAEQIKKYLKEKYHKPGNVFLGIVHRLDRPTAGIMVFARTSKAAARLSAQFRTHTIKKLYHAEVLGYIEPPSGTLRHYLLKNSSKNKTDVFDSVTSGAKEAISRYQLINYTDSGNSLVAVSIITGRSHQIRSQFAHIGHPIVGDGKYGAPGAKFHSEIHLKAVELQFEHPVSKEHLVFRSEETNFLT
jgi:23S rRNA pseudouridine1911/1915/1917 synthase